LRDSQFSQEKNARVTTLNGNRPMTFISSIRRRVHFVFDWPLSTVRRHRPFARSGLSIHRSIPFSLWTESSIDFAHTVPLLIHPICLTAQNNQICSEFHVDLKATNNNAIILEL
jgi:hypothetical protein